MTAAQAEQQVVYTVVAQAALIDEWTEQDDDQTFDPAFAAT
jgi:hypothetical protein